MVLTLPLTIAVQLVCARIGLVSGRGLAGEGAYLLFTIGLVGTGLLAIPVLAGSASYAIAELFGWRSGLDLKPRQGRRFYVVLSLAIVAGMRLDGAGMNPVRMLFVSAVLNGVLAPPLLVALGVTSLR